MRKKVKFQTLFAFISNVDLKSIKLQVQFLELSFSICAFTFVNNENDKYDRKKSSASKSHSYDPVFAVICGHFLVLQLTQGVEQITYNHLNRQRQLIHKTLLRTAVSEKPFMRYRGEQHENRGLN